MADRGMLQVIVEKRDSVIPLENARVEISDTGNPSKVLEVLETNVVGQTATIELNAPPVEYSMEPGPRQPYAQYNIKVEAPGYETTLISGVQVLPEEKAISTVSMDLQTPYNEAGRDIVIGPNTLFGQYPPKQFEPEIKTVTSSGEVVLSRVVIPEYVVVHDGGMRDSSAKDYYVLYKDYIKNVASCEIYATWPAAALRANVLAIMSFTLNRVYTEWYRNKGYNYTITASTAYDQKWIYGHNTFQSIDRIVDEIFNSYLARPNVTQPLLAQYCDGKELACPEYLSQWGSKYLADDGLSSNEILKYYYGDNLVIKTAETISGVPSSYPGDTLSIGSSGQKVRQMQTQLNTIAKDYPLIQKIKVDGIFGKETAKAVSEFQQIFQMPVTGEVDFATWYKISQIYVGVSKIAELR